jgi:hypothetical protein
MINKAGNPFFVFVLGILDICFLYLFVHFCKVHLYNLIYLYAHSEMAAAFIQLCRRSLSIHLVLGYVVPQCKSTGEINTSTVLYPCFILDRAMRLSCHSMPSYRDTGGRMVWLLRPTTHFHQPTYASILASCKRFNLVLVVWTLEALYDNLTHPYKAMWD